MSRRLKILVVVGILLGLAILIPVIHHYQLRAKTEAYIAELKAKGEPMDLAQVVPPPVPPEINAALLITNALAEIYLERNWSNAIFFNNSPIAMNRAIPGQEMIGWHEPVIHAPDTWPRNLTNTWAELGAQLAERQNDLNDFRKLIDNPKFDFDYDYSNSKMYTPTLAPHLSQIKMAIQWLEASEFYNLHQNKTAEACTDVRAMLAFVKGQTDERFLISQLVRFAIVQMVAGATWDVLQTTNVSDENLAQLQQDWESLEFIVPLKKAFLFERVSELQLVDFIRKSPTNLDAQVDWTQNIMSGWRNEYTYKRTENGTYVVDDERNFYQKVIDEISTEWAKLQWRWFWSYTDEVRGVQMWRVIIDGPQILEANHSFQSVQLFVNTDFTQIGFDSMKDNPYAIISQNANGQIAAIRRLASVETARNIVITAIALKRYELRHHQLPATLNELTPDLLKSVPIDYMDGQPSRYRRNADGTFLLYSVGENGKDNGGNGSWDPNIHLIGYSWQYYRALDWVWPQPATPEEVQKFYESLPK